MTNANEVDWVMETHLQKAYDELAWLITEGKVSFEEAYNRLRWGYAREIADDFKEWWDEVDL